MPEQFTFDVQPHASRSRAKAPPADAGAQAGAYAAGSHGQDGHLLDYVRVLYKRRWLALTAFILVVGTATVYTFTATRIFGARVQLLIEPENPNVVSFKEVIEQDKATNDYYQTQYRILQSRALARKTIDGLKLWNSSEFGGGPATPSFSVRGAIAGGVAGVKGWFIAPKPAEPRGANETAAQSAVIDAFLSRLTVVPIRNSRLVDVRFESPAPEMASTVANALAKAYIEQNLEFKFMASKEASDWLGQRLAEQRKQVEVSEVALQRYREQNDAISLEERQDIVVQKLADLNSAVTRAKTERFQKEALYDQVRSIQKDRAALDTFPAILSNSFIQQLKTELAELQGRQAQLSEKLGDRHPEMIKLRSAIQTAAAKLQGEITKVVHSVRNEFLAAQAQERSLMGALEAQKQDALAMNRKAIDYGALQRDAATNRQIFESLLQRTKETGISGELKSSNIRVVDAAEVPRVPLRPNKRNNLFFALFGGTALAAGLAFFFEYLDNRIKSPDEVKAHLHLPFLGMIPALSAKNPVATPLINNGVLPNFAEAFRTVRTNVLFSSAEEGTRSLVITSTRPGEGKTVVASNLAMALAQAGQRVLLIDADMRRPQIHRVFGQSQEPGLSNLLVGDAKASETVKRTDVPGLWLLASGRIPPNPAELLGSQRFNDFLASLGEHFEWIVIDSPPVMAVADASVVAHAASGVVFVVGSEMTGRQAAQAALEQLDAARARFVGAVLNRVDLERNSYYYAQYYRREYSAYYAGASRSS